MLLLEKQLFIKQSNISRAGKGLFTKQYIAKGTRIIEYKGRVTTWKEILENKAFNPYVYYINKNHVIDAKPYIKALARYANDARGLNKVKALVNNSKFVKEEGRVFIDAIRDIPSGAEILVNYKKGYWDVIKYNKKLALKQKKSCSKAKK